MKQSLEQIEQQLKQLQGKEVIVYHKYGWQKIQLLRANRKITGKNHFCIFNTKDVQKIEGTSIWLY